MASQLLAVVIGAVAFLLWRERVLYGTKQRQKDNV